MGPNRPTKQPATHHPIQGNVVAVSTKANFRRPVPKTYSYRYEVNGDTGPAGEPLVHAGAAIIEGRYRGRAATWNIARSIVEPETYLVRGGYVHPLEENPMAYPPRGAMNPATLAAAAARTPGFPMLTQRFDSAAPPAAYGAPLSRRPGARPTPANGSAQEKTGV